MSEIRGKEHDRKGEAKGFVKALSLSARVSTREARNLALGKNTSRAKAKKAKKVKKWVDKPPRYLLPLQPPPPPPPPPRRAGSG